MYIYILWCYLGGGDNVVLAQQCARYLLSSLQHVRSGKSVHNTVSYFKDYERILNQKEIKIREWTELLNPEFYLHALKSLSLFMLTEYVYFQFPISISILIFTFNFNFYI